MEFDGDCTRYKDYPKITSREVKGKGKSSNKTEQEEPTPGTSGWTRSQRKLPSISTRITWKERF